jgi:thioester reductase-like protein/NADP-dependent 3-hydroxy acid dehydrogenase YdfG
VTYFVTGATGTLGRHLVAELLARREGQVAVLVPHESLPRLSQLQRRRWQSERIEPVVGDLTAPYLGVDPAWIEEHKGTVSGFFSVGAAYDVTASPERNEQVVVVGTRSAVTLAAALGADTLHHVSSVAVAGDYRGVFDETMFDEGQSLPSAYHRTAFDAERIVREECTIPWRIYRPSIVVGSSQTGAMDAVDGPYYLFPSLKRLRDVPDSIPLVSVDLGDANVVPADYVASALDHLASVEGLDGQTFHLVNPEPQSTVDAINTLASAAGAPRFAVPIDRTVTAALPQALVPISLLTTALRSPPAQRVLAHTIGRLGIPPAVITDLAFTATFAAGHTERATAGSGIVCPSLESYAAAIWDYWELHLDPAAARDVALRKALQERKVVVTGATSSLGRAMALKIAQAGGTSVLVGGSTEDLEETAAEVEETGSVTSVFAGDLADLEALDALTERIVDEHPLIDIVVNLAGYSSTAPLPVASSGFSDLDRTIQVDFLGPVRIVGGLLPALRASEDGHLVNVGPAERRAAFSTPASSAAARAAFDAWSRAVSSELSDDGIRLTSLHVPEIREQGSEVHAGTATSTITAAQAAGQVLDAIKSSTAPRRRPAVAPASRQR